ncbi:MAG: hypothetical protein AAF657_19265 [Acidobacteriota bacterium]
MQRFPQLGWASILLFFFNFGSTAAADDAGLLPRWVDDSQAASVWVETVFPQQAEFPLPVTGVSRYLIVELAADRIDRWQAAAFELKNLVVEARSVSPQLEVALDGPPQALEQLLPHGLAPYIDAYIYRDQPTLPQSDPTARLWWRTEVAAPQVLSRLLTAAADGAQLVVLEGLTLEPAQHEMLEAIRATRAADLVPQPRVSGVGQDQVRFFLDPDSGHHYLAVQAPEGGARKIQFHLQVGLAAASLYPDTADFDFTGYGASGELSTFGAHPYYLFELTSDAPETPHSAVEVADTEILDPYEIVVKNQVFQRNQAAKIDNLVVNERVYTLSQLPRSRPITRDFRVIQRRGHPTDYIWTGLAVNGVPYPKNKLRQGFIFDADQVLVDALAIELDRTYDYTYLGNEAVDGHPTWKIGFEPTREGAYLSGTVWIDQATHAHRKLAAKQHGTLEPVVNREFTLTYDWVEQDGERYWTWSRNEGTAVLSYLGFHQPVTVLIDRSGYELNTDSADEEIQVAHASDAKIMRDTPDGLRWLTRKKVKRRRGESTRHLDRERDSDIQTGAYERVLADRNHISQNRRLGFLYVYDPSFGDENPFTDLSFNFFDLNVRGSKLQLFLNADEFGFLSLAYPGVIRKNWVLSLDIEPPSDFYDRVAGTSVTQELEFERASATLALAMPLSPSFSLYARYGVRDISYRPLDDTVPDFVLPAEHLETLGRLEMKYDRQGFSSELVLEVGDRDEWTPWGIDASEPLESSYFKAALRAGYYRQLSRNQSMGLFASYLTGSGLDRFSRIRLGFGGFRVAGYSSQVRFDEGFGINFNYSGHFLKLFPLQLRLDFATVQPNNDLFLDGEYFVGAEIVTTLHGPWKTDLFLSLGRGLATSLDAVEDEGTRFVALLSRRF